MNCPICQAEMRLIPAGVSKKTGKPYASFWGCTTYGCKGTVRIPTEGQNPQEGASTQSTARPSYDKFPAKAAQTAMDYKATQISRAQDNKEESMKLFASGRDATLMMTSGVYVLTDEEKKKKLLEWRDWFYQNIYNMSEDEYKSLNAPF